MSHYKPYPAYKDSGVEWLGQVPEHWQVKRLKFIATVQTGVAKGKDNVGRDTIEVPYLRVANVQDGYLSLDDVTTIEIPREDLPRYSLKPGDVLMNEGGDFDKLGRGHVWQGEIEPCIHQNHVFAVRPAKVPPHWLNAFTGSQTAQFYFMGRSKQSTNLASISSSNVMELPVVVPPDDELPTVLAYLDRETARLDALIEKKTRFIELLREKRQALITHAVTKGLDPNVKMKGSGVEWLGEVPEHWDMSPLKRLVSSISQGWSPECEARIPEDGEWGVVKVGCVNGGVFRPEESKALPTEMEPRPELSLKAGDVLISRANTRELVGSCAVVARDYPNLLLCDKLYRVGCSERVTSDFLAALVTVYGRRAVEIEATGASSSMVNIAQSVILDLLVAVPGTDEQVEIISRISAATNRIERLREKTERSIDLLKERRSALITAAVTGQIDLREVV